MNIEVWKAQIRKREILRYLNNIQKNRFFKLRKKLLELQKSFMELKDREFHDKEVKLK